MRHRVREVSAASPPRSSPARTAVVALAALSAIAGLFVALALVGRGFDVEGFDRSVTDGVHGLFGADARGTMRILTYLGGTQVALPLTALVALGLARLRDRPAMVGLIVAYAATQAIVTLVKLLVGRDRPAGSLEQVGGYAFPSGHSATAVALYGALALIVARRWGPRGRVAAIAGAVLLAAIVGVTRVYLGVHYPTDVLGGWLLGATVLAVAWRLFATRPAA